VLNTAQLIEAETNLLCQASFFPLAENRKILAAKNESAMKQNMNQNFHNTNHNHKQLTLRLSSDLTIHRR